MASRNNARRLQNEPLDFQSPAQASGWSVAWSGLLALAVAMGIGRFAFTPLLPMMLHDRVIDLQAGGWLATANYVGYFLGALSCLVIRSSPARMIRLGLGMTVALTLIMGLSIAMPLPLAAASLTQPLWMLLRAASGIASAWVFVFGSSWCLLRLAQLQAPRLGGIIYCGPGIGIFITGLLAGAAATIGWHASSGWLLFGLLAAILSALIWGTFDHAAAGVEAAPSTHSEARLTAEGTLAAPVPERAHRIESRILTFTYGLAGFGYIITATFLPVIARDALPHSSWADLFWPLFGLCVALGAWLAVFIPVNIDQRRLLGACYLMQAAGVLVSVARPSLAGFALSSILLGLPFTAITLFAMREARRLGHALGAPASRLMGLLTAAYGLGQIAGPPLATRLVRQFGNFTPSLLVAAIALGTGATVLFFMPRYLPAGQPRPQPHST